MALRLILHLPENLEAPAIDVVGDCSLYWRRRERETLLSADHAGNAALRNIYLDVLVHHRRMAALS